MVWNCCRLSFVDTSGQRTAAVSTYQALHWVSASRLRPNLVPPKCCLKPVFKKSLILQLPDCIRQEGEFIAVEPLRITSIREDDRMFYEVAKTGRAAYLVTGNKRHFPNEDIVRTPKEFVDIYLSRE